MGKAAAKKCSAHAIHVDHNEALDRWDVVDQEGGVIGHCQNQDDAVDLAIEKAKHLHGRGDDAVVCVEQSDGHYSLAWSSQ